MTDEEYEEQMYALEMGEIAVTSAKNLGWTKDMIDNAIQFLVTRSYREGWDNAEKHSFDVGA